MTFLSSASKERIAIAVLTAALGGQTVWGKVDRDSIRRTTVEICDETNQLRADIVEFLSLVPGDPRDADAQRQLRRLGADVFRRARCR